MRQWLECARCGSRLDLWEPVAQCPSCGGLLEILTAPEDQGASWREPPAETVEARSGVWRFRDWILPDALPEQIVSFPEGNTPLLERRRLSSFVGIERLTIKHEGLNPTGSFKDRGMTVAITHAKRLGVRGVVCASTGNTAASLAAYAAQAELPAIVLVPAGKIAIGKLAQSIAHGARVLSVRGTFDDCLELVSRSSDRLGLYLVNSVNPFRLAGQMTIGLEILRDRSWRSPDWIVVPAGNLGNTAALGMALRQAKAAGLIDRLPRIAAIQAAGAAPFAASYATGFESLTPVEPETVATAIRIGRPASYDRAVKAIRATDGVVIAVSDEEILEAKRAVDETGVGCEPASAASVAGVRALVESGTISRDAEVVAVLTGHLLKDPETLISDASRHPVEIDPTVESIERILAQDPGGDR